MTAIDEEHPAYRQFLECFIRGASLQDIYGTSDKGFGVRPRERVIDDAAQARMRRSCRVQFDRVFSHTQNLATPLERTIGLAGKSVLDFGSGTGALAVAVALKGATVTACDPTRVSLDACEWRARYFNLDADRVRTVHIGTTPSLPFPDASFDVVTCNSVFEFIPEGRDAHVRELCRVLRPGGHLVISTENGLYPRDYYTRRLFPLLRRPTMRRDAQPYGSTYFELLRWAKQSGRQVVDRSKRNEFNSLDHFVARRQQANPGAVSSALRAANEGLKRTFRLVGLPSQLLFPYTTFIFQVN